MKQFIIRLPDELHAVLKKTAIDHQMTMHSYIIKLLEYSQK